MGSSKTQKKWGPKVRNESVSKKEFSFAIDNHLEILWVPIVLAMINCSILGYGDLVQGNIMIKRVYYVEGLNHNLFSVGQFCDADLEHQMLSHLNFDYINLLSKKDIVIGLPKLKYVKDQLCSSCEVSPKGLRVYKIEKPRLICLPRLPIHLRFDEIKRMSETSVANELLAHSTTKQTASDYDNPEPRTRTTQMFIPSADQQFHHKQELGSSFDTHPSTNIHPTSEPSTPTNVHAEENNDNQAEFTNPFCTPVQENVESSSRNIGNSNVHNFNQPQDSEYRWTKDHPLTQVRGNPSKPVQTR
ncbi:retrovirus-related pol polyprotein from transposon TNT 1-94 [Tanacetum coccineum]